MIKLTLTAYNMGDVTEEDFDAWARYVAARIDDMTGLDVDVDQGPFTGERGVLFDDMIDHGDEDHETCTQNEEIIQDALRDLWDSFCAEGWRNNR
jgi:hypothetical protein